MIKALIFDFDGLILDTELPEYQVWQEIYQAYGCQLPLELWAKCIGTSVDAFDPIANLESQIQHALDREDLLVRRRQRVSELLLQQPILPGVEDYIKGAKQLGLKVAVASSSSHKWVDGHLARLGLIEHFTSIKCSDDVAKVKPDPALYLDTLIALNVRADQAIVFEDSPNGLLAANRAGIYCVAVPNQLTSQLPLDHASMQIRSMADMPLEELLATVQKNNHTIL